MCSNFVVAVVVAGLLVVIDNAHFVAFGGWHVAKVCNIEIFHASRIVPIFRRGAAPMMRIDPTMLTKIMPCGIRIPLIEAKMFFTSHKVEFLFRCGEHDCPFAPA